MFQLRLTSGNIINFSSLYELHEYLKATNEPVEKISFFTYSPEGKERVRLVNNIITNEFEFTYWSDDVGNYVNIMDG